MIIEANIDGWAVSTILDEDLLGVGFPPSPAPVCCNRIVRGEVPARSQLVHVEARSHLWAAGQAVDLLSLLGN